MKKRYIGIKDYKLGTMSTMWETHLTVTESYRYLNDS